MSIFNEWFPVQNSRKQSVDEMLQWVSDRRKAVSVDINFTSLDKMTQWSYNSTSSAIVHESGKFFSIGGLAVEDFQGNKKAWSQPIIIQPEVGILGCLVKKINGVYYALVQAKIEPGNVNHVQLSPTVQATRSNFTRIHKGRYPRYLEYFQQNPNCQILVDQLQSEQGTRFLHKRNRNVIIEVFEDVPEHDDYRWVSIADLKILINMDNLINMDLRSVLSALPVNEICSAESKRDAVSHCGNAFLASAIYVTDTRELNNTIMWLSKLRSEQSLKLSYPRLDELSDWKLTGDGIYHTDNKFFEIKWCKITIGNREVTEWDQPLVAPCERAISALFVTKIDGILKFLVQAKSEIGLLDGPQLTPTISISPSSYDNIYSDIEFYEFFEKYDDKKIIYDSLQSEEGGRFYQESNRYMIIEVANDLYDNFRRSHNFKWVSLNTLLSLMRHTNFLSIQLRTLLAKVEYI